MTRERPILFSGEMVRAIIDHRKTQTRRAMKPQPAEYVEALRDVPLENRYWPASIANTDFGTEYERVHHEPPCWICPYGAAGDRLWVREAWSAELEWPVSPGRSTMNYWQEVPAGFRGVKNAMNTYYRADMSEYDVLVSDDGSSHSLNFNSHVSDSELIEYEDDRPLRFRWVPSIHMPRWASRLTLELTGVRVERVQSITSADARAEGCVASERESEADAYHALWDSLNTKRGYSFESNPWVWVLEFRVASKNSHD